jgi:hypothetical protein
VKVAAQAGVGQVPEGKSASVLFRNNVLNLKRGEDVSLREMAVFAAGAGSLPNLLLDGFGHP